MIYLDTSLLVAALTDEEASEKVQRWLADQETGALCISGWVVTEFSNAVALKLRRGTLMPDEAELVRAQWQSVREERLVRVPVPEAAFALAASFVDQPKLVLRSGDALHLAVASLGDHALATLDRGMREGADALGVRVVGL